MKIEDYMLELCKIAAEHPGADMKAYNPIEDCEVGLNYEQEFDAHPEWSERDKFVYVDCNDER